jgi:hypothetical protein
MGKAGEKRPESPTDTEIGAAGLDEQGKPLGPIVKTDAVFGEINGDSGPDFRSVSLITGWSWMSLTSRPAG